MQKRNHPTPTSSHGRFVASRVKTAVLQCDVCSHEDVICDDFADHMSKKHQVLLERHALPQDDDNDDADLIEIARKHTILNVHVLCIKT